MKVERGFLGSEETIRCNATSFYFSLFSAQTLIMGELDNEDLAILILMEDEEFDMEDCRSEESDLFKSRSKEGTFNILVHRHLVSNEETFRKHDLCTLFFCKIFI